MTDKDLTGVLAANGLRSTADRRRILSLFLEDRAWTVSQVHENLKDTDLSTVYRNVNTLAENGILQPAPIHGKEAYYELSLREHHAHRICRECGAAFCVPCTIGDATDEHSLEIYTVCAECSGDAR